MSARHRIRSAAWLLLLALGACAPKPWLKEGASDENLQQDLKACEAEAYKEVQKRYAAVTNVPPAVAAPSIERRLNMYGSGPFADQYGTQLQAEEALTAECMQKKGYRQK